MFQQLDWTDGPVRWTEKELKLIGTDEMRNREEASGLRRFVFGFAFPDCLESEAISVGKAVRQIQRALPVGAGRAWRQEVLARRDGLHYWSTMYLGAG